MQESSLKKLERRRKMRRKKRIKKFIRFLLLIAIAALAVFCAIKTLSYFKNIEKADEEKINLKTLTAPEYVDVQLISNNQARTGKKIKHINDIVIHYTGNPGTTAQNNRDYFDKPQTEVCSHFVIGIDGEIIQCVPLDEKSAASNWRNEDTVSIEVCHKNEEGKFSDAAYASLVKLTSWLCDNSGLDNSHVIRHYDITGKKCPIYYVEHENAWKSFLKDVKESMG